MYIFNKFFNLIKHLLNVIPLYFHLLQDFYSLFWLLFSKSSRQNRTTFLVNQRCWGFGHQLLELRFARKLAHQFDVTLLTTKNFSNKFLHQKMTECCIRIVSFNFEFSYDIASAHIEKTRKHIDIGGSPNEIIYNLSIKYDMQYKVSKSAQAGYSRIYKSFPKHDFTDLPNFFNTSEESCFERKIRNYGINPNDWFCVLHIRNGRGWSKIRDTNLDTYNESIEEIIKQGGQVLLTGNDLSDQNSKSFPYLPDDAPADLQLFALSRQRLMLASCSGPAHSSFLFDIPVITTNNVLWEFFTWSLKDSSLPKMIRDKATGKLLNRSQYMELRRTNKYSIESINDHYESVDNSSKEILTAVKNKLDELEKGNYSPRISQSPFRDGFDKSDFIHSTFSKIDSSYYEKYLSVFTK